MFVSDGFSVYSPRAVQLVGVGQLVGVEQPAVEVRPGAAAAQVERAAQPVVVEVRVERVLQARVVIAQQAHYAERGLHSVPREQRYVVAPEQCCVVRLDAVALREPSAPQGPHCAAVPQERCHVAVAQVQRRAPVAPGQHHAGVGQAHRVALQERHHAAVGLPEPRCVEYLLCVADWRVALPGGRRLEERLYRED